MPSSDSHHPLAHLVAGAPRHVAIEHGHGVLVHAEPLQGGIAVVADIHGHGQLAQPVSDGVSEQPLVVGQ